MGQRPGRNPPRCVTMSRMTTPHIVSDKTGKPIQSTLAWIIAVCTLGYMLPWAIAATRGKANAGAIGWLNLLLGWTFIGWIVALVMACGAHAKMIAPRD